MKDLQPEDLWSVTRLDLIAGSLTRVARDDGEVLASNGEDGATVVAVRVEVTLLRCGLAVRDVGNGRGQWHGHRTTAVAERVEVTLLRCGLAAQVRVALVLQQFLRQKRNILVI